MAIKDSILVKNTELQKAIDDAQALIDDVNSDPEQAKSAMDLVKKLEADIDTLKELEKATPSDTGTPKEPETDKPTDPKPTDVKPDDPKKDNPKTADDGKEPTPPASDDPIDGEPATDPEDDKKKEKENRAMPIQLNSTNKKTEVRSLLNDFLHSKGEKRDGLTSTDAGVLIPESIIYDPSIAIETVTDLAGLVTKQKVATPSGKYPILKRASTTLPSVEELAKNPELAKPEFIDVRWEIVTYRGVVPISQESIDDAQVDLTALVSNHINQIKINTTNDKIAKVLAGFTAKTLDETKLVDDLKDLKNVTFDPAYNLGWVMTQSMFNALDKVKDGDGRYLLQDQIGTETGKTLFGLSVNVVEDKAFGATGEAKQVWIGDLKRAILFADRVDANVRWVDNDIYGQVLQAVIRFDVEKADPDAGVFASIAAPAESKVKAKAKAE